MIIKMRLKKSGVLVIYHKNGQILDGVRRDTLQGDISTVVS